MRLETPNGEIILYGDVQIKILTAHERHNETPTARIYFVRLMQDGREANYGEQFEITERQYNQIKQDMENELSSDHSPERSN